MLQFLSRLVQETWWVGGNPIQKVYKKVSDSSTFISDSIECENLEINGITRAKVVIGLMFKK